MTIFILYLLIVVIVSIVGSKRGRAVDGFIISLLLSPLIGLIWVFAMPNLKEK